MNPSLHSAAVAKPYGPHSTPNELGKLPRSLHTSIGVPSWLRSTNRAFAPSADTNNALSVYWACACDRVPTTSASPVTSRVVHRMAEPPLRVGDGTNAAGATLTPSYSPALWGRSSSARY